MTETWVLAGQSNMAGCAFMDDVEPPDPRVRAFNSQLGAWAPAVEPLQAPADSPRGAGLGLAFGKEVASRTGGDVELIPTAVGGTSLELWAPGPNPGVCYAAMLESVRAAGRPVTGVLWYQGESDTEAAELYRERTERLFAAMRADLGNPNLRIYMVQLGRCTGDLPGIQHAGWTRVRMEQTKVAGADGFTTAADLELDDPVHIGAVGLRRLGRRLGRLATGAASSIRPVEVTRYGTLGAWDEAEAPIYEVRIAFAGLTGGLAPRPHIPGFSVRDAEGETVPLIYRAEVRSGDAAAVWLRISGAPRSRADGIWYGWGPDPYCDLADSEDNAVPAFGPVPLTAD